MNIGELFLSIGIKGSEKTVGALSGVKTSLGDIRDLSFEAKAGILAAVYALERLTAASGAQGTALENFNALTGISTQTLQEYQYAARQVGISNEEMAGTFKTVQNVMTTLRLGKGAPEGLGILSGTLSKSGLGQFDVNKAVNDTTYVMKKLQEYALAEKNVGMRNFVLKSFGLSENMISGLVRNAFTPDIMAKAPRYGEGQIKELDRSRAAWSNLGTTVQMAIGKLNAAHGLKLVQDLTMLTNSVFKLTNALIKLSETLHVFEGLSQVFKEIGRAVSGTSQGVEALRKAGKQSTSVLDFIHRFEDSMKTPGKESSPPAVKMITPPNPVTPGTIAPKAPNNSVQPNSTQNNAVNQTFNFQTDGRDHKEVGDATQKAITKAYFQIQQGGY